MAGANEIKFKATDELVEVAAQAIKDLKLRGGYFDDHIYSIIARTALTAAFDRIAIKEAAQ
jgi:hypothetical protein